MPSSQNSLLRRKKKQKKLILKSTSEAVTARRVTASRNTESATRREWNVQSYVDAFVVITVKELQKQNHFLENRKREIAPLVEMQQPQTLEDGFIFSEPHVEEKYFLKSRRSKENRQVKLSGISTEFMSKT